MILVVLKLFARDATTTATISFENDKIEIQLPSLLSNITQEIQEVFRLRAVSVFA